MFQISILYIKAIFIKTISLPVELEHGPFDKPEAHTISAQLKYQVSIMRKSTVSVSDRKIVFPQKVALGALNTTL